MLQQQRAKMIVQYRNKDDSRTKYNKIQKNTICVSVRAVLIMTDGQSEGATSCGTSVTHRRCLSLSLKELLSDVSVP